MPLVTAVFLPTRRTALAALAGVPLLGCTPRRDHAALRLWAMSYEGDYAPLLIPAFTARTSIAVEVQSLPWTAAHEKLLTANAGGAMPDVVMLPNGWVGEFAMIGALRPVTDAGLIDDMFDGVRATVNYRGQAWAVPWSVAPQVQFYRRDIVEAAGQAAPPADWAAWRQFGLALKRRRPDDYYVLLCLDWYDALFTFAGQAGATLLRDRDTRGAFRSPEFRQALRFYKALFDDGLAPVALSTEVQDPVAAFAQGYFAIYPSGPSLLLDLRRRAAELPRARWATARMPGPHGPAAASGVSAALAVSRHATRPEQAWALVRHMTSATSELRFQSLIGNLPARRSAWGSPQLADAVLRPFAEQLRQPAAGPNIVEWERVRAEVQVLAERVVRGRLGLEDGLAEMDRRVDAVLAKRRALVDAGAIA